MNEYTGNSHVAAAYPGPGRRVAAMIEILHEDRHRTIRARDRGDTMIEIVHAVTSQGGQVHVEVEEADGARFSMTVAAPSLSDVENPIVRKTAHSEVVSPATALQAGDCAE